MCKGSYIKWTVCGHKVADAEEICPNPKPCAGISIVWNQRMLIGLCPNCLDATLQARHREEEERRRRREAARVLLGAANVALPPKPNAGDNQKGGSKGA